MALSEGSTDTPDIGTQSYSNTSYLNATSFLGSSGTPAQINIGGNARVHLGDQYNHGTHSVPERIRPSSAVRPTDSAMVSTAMQVIEFCLLVFSTKDHDRDSVYGPIHAQLARDRILVHRSKLLGNITSLEQSTSIVKAALTTVGREVQNFFEMGDSVLVELLTGSANVAEGLAAALDDVYTTTIRQPKRPYSSLREMVSIVSPDEQLVSNMLDSLKVLGEKAVLALLMVMRPLISSDEPMILTSSESTERILVQSALALWDANQSSIKKLYSTTSSWLSIPWASTKTAAQKWLSAHASLVADCLQSILSKMSTERNRSIRLRIFNNLAYTEMDRRYNSIPQAHARTLEWLFKNDDCNVSSSQQNFARWLRASDSSDARLYWIRGKPGSGKSTLMRYLLDDPRTKVLGKAWAGETDLLIVSCFFWNSGTKLQKSQEGLLQTLLYQLLSASESFSHHLFQMRWSLLQVNPEFDQPWSVSELRNAIFRFVLEHRDRFKILFLIDGLDEYQGTNSQRESICVLLKELSHYNNVKVCTSSRPWNVYKDAFQSTPQLRLEFLTKPSIRNFIKDHFDANERYRKWSDDAPEDASHLINDLVQKASGVFLWVRLVVGIVLRGLQDGDNTHDLSRRLSDIPTDLEDLFRQLLSQIEPSYLESASKTFELTLRGSGHCNLVMIHFLIHEHKDTVGPLTQTSPLSIQEALQRQEIQERRINAQCMGLLELVAVEDNQTCSLHMVEFLHRTARDFMATEEMHQRLLSWRKTPWNLSTALLEARIRLLQSCNLEDPWMAIPIQLTVVAAILSQLANDPDANVAFPLLSAGEGHLNDLLDVARRHYARTGQNDGISLLNRLERDQTDFLGLAIEDGAVSYVLSRLSVISRDDIQARKGRPLLDLALMSRLAKRSAPSVYVVNGLLTLGADPNTTWAGSTIWSRFLVNLSESKLAQETIKTYVEVTRLLVLAGAPGKIYLEETDRTLILESVLRAKFPKIEADELLSLKGGVRGYMHGKRSKIKFWTSSSPR